MIAEIDGHPIHPKHLSYRNLNYGQFRDMTGSIHAYTLCVTREEFIAKVRAPYEQCLTKLRADDEQWSVSSEYPRLDQIGYLSIEHILDYPQQCCDLIKDFLDHDLFAAFLDQNSPHMRYVLNSTDTVEYRDGTVIICGRAYRLGWRNRWLAYRWGWRDRWRRRSW